MTNALSSDCQEMTDTVAGLLQWSENLLASKGIENSGLDSELLLAEAFSIKRQDIWIYPQRVPDQKETNRFKDFIRRRAAREPFAYIIGRKQFWSLDFRVNSEVMAPRPETEVLIECLLKIVRENYGEKNLRILDMGTGSGNIAITAARELPQCKVTAVDLSAGALAVANENIRAYDLSDRIQAVQGDLFSSFRVEDAGRFDFILSNPPYIRSEEIGKLMPEVRDYEPRCALDAGITGLGFYERIIPLGHSLIREGGFIIFEIGMDQAEAITRTIETHGGYETPCIRQDYSGRDRVLSARRRTLG